ncbi:hypothetical protein OSB04_007711 [Centaurea solstitialis]|uniref:RNA-directed DNA polymerase n=1 Tax=Centaurea solstitialis TaxID=347529 RepID=A0AA38WTF5_9ASTR|nr:hypothetical protein OSB04_007711 [Centaurea solstitialis]
MEKYEELRQKIDGQDATLKQMQESISELAAAVKLLAVTRGTKPNLETEEENSYVFNSGGTKSGPQEETEGDLTPPSPKPGYQLVNRMTKLEFPPFEGDDFKDWHYKCNQFFELDNTPEKMKIRLVAIHLKGRALQWHQGFMKEMEGKPISWKNYLDELREKFVGGTTSKPLIELKNLKLTTTVSDYNTHFNALRNQVDVPSEVLLDLYIGGLRNEIMHTVQLMDPKTLNQAMKLARIQEGAYYALWGLDPPKPPISTLDLAKPMATPHSNSPAPASLPAPKFLPTAFPNRISHSFHKPAVRNHPPPTPQGLQNRTTPFKQLTKREYDEKRKNNQCFFCNEKYVPGHKCRNNKLYMLICPENNEEGEEAFDGEERDTTREEDVSFSIHAMLGTAGLQTIQINGHVKKQPVLMLVDSGSTNNFVDLSFAKKLGLRLTPIKRKEVTVADGFKLSVQYVCKEVHWSVQGVNFCDDFLAMPIGGYGVVTTANFDHQLHPQRALVESEPGLNLALINRLETLNHKEIRRVNKSSGTAENEEQAYIMSSDEKCSELWSIRKKELQAILKDFEDVFASPSELPPKRALDHSITLQEGCSPVNLRAYRYGALQKNVIEELVQEMLSSGVIRPSHSNFASPVVLVKKKDGKWRFCVDYRKLNHLTVRNQFPIPIVEELIDELHGSCYFSKLDLRSGYHQVRMNEADIGKTTFRTHEGLYEFVVMPFGLTNAPATFQSLMNSVFKPYLRRFVLVFFDDILVYSKSWSEHLQHLQSVLQLLRKNSLFARLSKCTFGSDQVDYLGYVISGNGVKADPKKIEDMVNWPKPVTIKELRGFLGLIGYYRRFVRDYGKIARPLTNLLKNGSFCWEGEADMAFQKLKEAMSRASVLALPDFEKPFIIETDASGVGVGAVLIQDKHPIAFFSRALATYERELLAIVAAIQRWKGYLLGRPFIIKTDHQALKHILEQKECHPTLQKWLSKLLGLQYTVMYNKGSDNQVADALSRRPNEVPLSSCLAISSVMSEWKERIILSVTTDGKLQAIMDVLKENSTANLVRKGRLVVGDDPTLKLSALGGHSGVHAINQRLSRVVYWKGMQAQVREAVRSCHVFQQCKNERSGHRKDNFSNSRRLIRICGYALRLNKRSRYLPEFNEFCLQAVLKEVCFATSKSWSEHLQHLQSVLQLLRKNSLFARLSKCTFGSDQVDYLGYVISGNGVKADPKKIEDMVNWPKPVTIKELRGFLGLIGYYRRFVRDYGKIARPLTNLLKNGSFCWEGEADMAFQKLKEAMSRASVLALPDFEKPFIIETDASEVGVGAVLIQDKHPIAFFSRALATYERELLAIVAAIQRWKGYLLGRPFIIKTDHQALKHILEQKECHPTLQKWLSKLLGLQYTVMYNKGSDNQVADALSRRPNEVPLSSCLAISSVMSEWKERIILSVTTDGKLQAIMDYQLEDGNLVRKGRLVVGDDPTLKLVLSNFSMRVHWGPFGCTRDKSKAI